MKTTLKKISTWVVLSSIVGSVPMMAMAGTSAAVGFANMYLWRGQNLTPDGPAFSGSLDFSHASGARAGIWGSNEDDGIETDLYVGFGKKFGALSVDLSYWKYLYPQNTTGDTTGGDLGGTQTDLGDTDQSEAVLALGFGPATFTAYINVESDTDSDNYYTLQGNFGKFSALFGLWDLENPGDPVSNAGGLDEYSHLQLGYQANDNLSFGLSFAFSDNTDLAGSVEEDPLFLVSYALNFDLDKK